MKKFLVSAGPYIALALLVAVCVATCASFRNPATYVMMGRQAAYTGVVALGMTLVIAAGGIDLSVGSLFALSGVAALVFVPHGGEGMGGFLLTAAVALAVGAAGGAVNGALTGFGGIPPFIVTLGTMSIFRSLALYMADAGRVAADNPHFDLLSGGVTIGALVAAAAVFHLLLAHTPFGTHVCAVGSNEKVARYAAINTGLVKFFTYLFTGVLCGASAFLWAGRLGGVSSANDGLGYELDAIAAVIVGGTSMSGGKASIWGTIAGVLILTVISNALVPWGVSPKLQDMVKGMVIIVAVLTQYKKRNS